MQMLEQFCVTDQFAMHIDVAISLPLPDDTGAPASYLASSDSLLVAWDPHMLLQKVRARSSLEDDRRDFRFHSNLFHGSESNDG